MRVRIAAAVSAAVIGGAACAGCSGAGPSAGNGTPPEVIVLPARSVPSPGCSTATAAPPPLSGVRTAMLSVPGSPFGVAVTPDGRYLLAAGGSGAVVISVARAERGRPGRRGQ